MSEYSKSLNRSVQKVETKYDWYNSKYDDISKSSNTLSYILQNNTIYDEKVTEQVDLAAKKQYSAIKGEFL